MSNPIVKVWSVIKSNMKKELASKNNPILNAHKNDLSPKECN